MSLYKTKLSSHDYLTMINKKKDSPLQSKIYAAFLIYVINVMVCQHIFGYLSFMLLFWFNKYHDLSAYFSLICLPFFLFNKYHASSAHYWFFVSFYGFSQSRDAMKVSNYAGPSIKGGGPHY